MNWQLSWRAVGLSPAPTMTEPNPCSHGITYEGLVALHKEQLAAQNDAKLRLGVWRRAPMDWAYRIEVEGYGSIAGVGFSTKAEAREAMRSAREEALSNG